MFHFLHIRVNDEGKAGQLVAGVENGGAIEVIVSGRQQERELVPLACPIAKQAKCRIHLIWIIEVPRAFPLAAPRMREAQQAEAFLTEALGIVKKAGCDAVATVVQVRDTATAIIDEARDLRCCLILLGHNLNTERRVPNDLGKIIPYVLTHAPCRVWVVQDWQAA